MNRLLILAAVLSGLWYGYSFSQPLFDPPVNLGPKINSSAYEADPFWDGPRKRLYFVSARDGSEDIWYSDWTDTGWTNAQKLGPEINSLERELSPSVSPDGQKFYYITFARPGAINPWDIWVSSWDSSLNDWGTPFELGCPVNTPGVEYSSKIGPDGIALYFFSTNGNCDSFFQQSGLLYSVFDSLIGWSIPQSLGPNINAGGGEEYASITADSSWLYFQRNAGTFASPWTDSGWGPAFNLTPQMGERGFTPSIVPSGESLFFYTPLLGGFGNGDIFLMELQTTRVGEGKEARFPNDFELRQNYPNPFNVQTQISFFVSKNAKGTINLTIYNLLGQPIRHLLKNESKRGEMIQTWDGLDDDGKEVSTGVYFYELRIGNQRSVKKAVLVK